MAIRMLEWKEQYQCSMNCPRAATIAHGDTYLCEVHHRQIVTPGRSIVPVPVLREQMAFTLDLLFDQAWSYIAAGKEGKKIAKMTREAYKSDGARAIAAELYTMHMVMQAIQDTLEPSMGIIRDMMEKLKSDSIPKPKRLSLPRSRCEDFRRDFIKGLFNAVRPKGAGGSRIGLQLGEMLFSSADDAARVDD